MEKIGTPATNISAIMSFLHYLELYLQKPFSSPEKRSKRLQKVWKGDVNLDRVRSIAQHRLETGKRLTLELQNQDERSSDSNTSVSEAEI
jgi:hypothetical protein